MSQHTETLQIEGMSCGHCVKAVAQALADVDGVTVDEVTMGTARVRYEASDAMHARLVEAVEEEGYTVVG